MRIFRGTLAAAALVAALVVSGCGSDDSASTTPSGTTATNMPAGNGAASATQTPATWTASGVTGSVTVTTASNAAAAPTIKVTTPFSVAQTQVHVLHEGTGATVGDNTQVSVNYVGVNGRTGTQFDSSYTRGAPASFTLAGVIPGFAKALAGQRVGATVAAAVLPADGYGPMGGNQSAGIAPDDTLVFVLTIVDAQGAGSS